MAYSVQVDEHKLSAILGALSAVAGNTIRFFQAGTGLWLGTPQENLPFCRALETHPETNRLCTQCDRQADLRNRGARGAFWYFCHAGLLEVHCPVHYEGVYAGFLNLGQYRSRKKPVDESTFAHLAALSGEDAARLKKACASHPALADEGVEGAKILLEMCAARLAQAGVFHIDYRDSLGKVERYIQEHLAGELTLKEIAAHIYVNPSYLSDMYRRATGQTLFQHIRRERVMRGCYLIRTTTLPMADIAAATGFKDPNYFAKAFRREMGLSPREYRSKLAAGEIIP